MDIVLFVAAEAAGSIPVVAAVLRAPSSTFCPRYSQEMISTHICANNVFGDRYFARKREILHFLNL